MNASLRERGLHGLSWAFAARVGGQIVQLGVTVALARLLTPDEFGIVGMLVVFTGFAQILAEFGLGSALIHLQVVTESHRSTAFWLQVGCGLVLWAIFYYGAPYIAEFYAVPILEPLSRLLSCVFVVQAIGQTHCAVMMRAFRFQALAVVSFASTVVSWITAVVLAWRGYGVWALAWQPLLLAVISTTLWWSQSGWVPHFKFSRAAAVQLTNYGAYLFGHSSINYWLRNGDNLIIGKVLGAYPLAIYSRAYMLMLLPMSTVSAVFGQVMFPLLSRVQDDLPRFARAYLKANRFIALMTFPMMFGFAALSAPLILLVFGDQWGAVVPVFRVLSFVGLFQSIIFPVAWIFTALGKTKQQFQLSIALAVVFFIAIGIGVQYGLAGVTYGYAAFTLVAGVANLHVAGRYIGLSVGDILMSTSKIFLLAAAMALAVVCVDATIMQTSSVVARSCIGVGVGVIAFAALCLLTREETFIEFMQIAQSRLSRDNRT